MQDQCSPDETTHPENRVAPPKPRLPDLPMKALSLGRYTQSYLSQEISSCFLFPVLNMKGVFKNVLCEYNM